MWEEVWFLSVFWGQGEVVRRKRGQYVVHLSSQNLQCFYLHQVGLHFSLLVLAKWGLFSSVYTYNISVHFFFFLGYLILPKEVLQKQGPSRSGAQQPLALRPSSQCFTSGTCSQDALGAVYFLVVLLVTAWCLEILWWFCSMCVAQLCETAAGNQCRIYSLRFNQKHSMYSLSLIFPGNVSLMTLVYAFISLHGLGETHDFEPLRFFFWVHLCSQAVWEGDVLSWWLFQCAASQRPHF